MAVSALALRPNKPEFTVVTSYYDAAKFENTPTGTIAVDRTDTYNNNFKHLCQVLLEKKRSRVIIVAHGYDDGLILPIAAETKTTISYGLRDLSYFVRDLDLAHKGLTKIDNKLVDQERVNGMARDWGMTAQSVMSLATTCWQIRRSADICTAVHVRGCEIGKNRYTLRMLRQLFRSAVVTAPKCPMFYVRPDWKQVGSPESAQNSERKIGRRYLYKKDGLNPMLLDLEYDGSSSRGKAYVQKQGDLAAWAKVFHKEYGTGTSLIVAGLYPSGDDDYFLAHEKGYPKLIESYDKSATD